jgi:hypothetical protein
MLEIMQNTRLDTKTGRTIRYFTPVFRGDVCSKGCLTFAQWEAWDDEPHTFEYAIDRAKHNAKEVLTRYIIDL